MDTARFKSFAADFGRACGRFFRALGIKIVNIFKTLYSNPKSAVGFSVILFFVVLAVIVAPLLNYTGLTDPLHVFEAPSAEHWLGTDSLGRDVLSMLIVGTGDVLTVAFLTAVVTVIFGTVVGIVSGLLGGAVDKVIQTITNLFLTIPSFPVLMLLSALITVEDNVTFALILSIWNWPGLCRAVRSQIISLKERDFIQICTVMKMSRLHIILRELLPNISSYIFINFVMIMKNAIIASVGIMMMGVAAYDPTNWGAMLYDIMNNAAMHIDSAIAYVIAPILFIVLLQFGIIMLANGLDEKLNPRLRRN